MRTSSFGPFTTLYGTMVISSVTSSYFRPMKRFTEKTVFSGFVTCWRRAGAPTSRWPSLVNATTDGVVRPPSAFGRTAGSPPSRVAMHELVVPRSIPIVLATVSLLACCTGRKSKPGYSRSWEHLRPRRAFRTVRAVEPETERELKATLAARQELGSAHDDDLIAGFLDRIGKEIDRRVDQQVAARAPKKRAASPLNPATLGICIPIIAIAGGIGHLPGLIAAFLA